MMTDTPEQIWIGPHGDYWADEDLGNGDVEYIRADLVPQWQPIETAPDDGTPVLVGWSSSFWHSMVAHFECGRWGGLNANMGFDILQVDPTHWKPLDTPKEKT